MGYFRAIRVLLLLTVTGAGVLDCPPNFAANPPAELSKPSASAIRRLIDQLGNNDYYLRRKAESELLRYRFDAVDALCQAAQSNDAEIASRAVRILAITRSNWALPSDPPEVAALLGGISIHSDSDPFSPAISQPAYPSSNESSSNGPQIDRLLALPQDAGLPAACRVLRYGPSILDSKLAALSILKIAAPGKAPSKAQANRVKEVLTGSDRDAARWLLCWARSADQPLAMTTDWAQCIANEERVLARGSSDSTEGIVAELLQLQIAWLRNLDRKQDAVAAFGRLMRLEKDRPEVLRNLLAWVIQQKDWESVELVARQFSSSIESNTELLYLLAAARANRGDRAAAEATAQRAFDVGATDKEEPIALHISWAYALHEQGQSAWAVRELRYVVSHQPPPDELGKRAYVYMAEILHDDENDEAAGDALKQVVNSFKSTIANRPLYRTEKDEEITDASLLARMNYFYACRAKSQGNRAEQKAFLEKSLATGAYDIEVLIAAYQMPDSPAKFRQEIREKIEKMASDLREQIADHASEASSAASCNEFAWLIGNTEGDFDEALRYSQSSVKFFPKAGGYFDTLARVYIAKGDYKSALEAQTKAMELTPHNKAMERQFEMLRKKTAKSG